MVGFKNSVSLPPTLIPAGSLFAILMLLYLPVEGQGFSLLADSTQRSRFNWETDQGSQSKFALRLPRSYTEIKSLPSFIKPVDYKVGDLKWSFNPIQGTARFHYAITPTPLKDISFGFLKTQLFYRNGHELVRQRYLRSFFEFNEPNKTEIFFMWQVKNLEILTTLQTGSLIGSAEPRFNPQKETLTIRLTYRF